MAACACRQSFDSCPDASSLDRDMRNIEADLRERFDALADERARLEGEYKARLRQLEERERALQVLIFEEQRQTKPTDIPLMANGTSKRSDNRDRSESANMILGIISDGRSWKREAIVTEMQARQFVFAGKSPRRVLHLALVNLQHAGEVQLNGEEVKISAE